MKNAMKKLMAFALVAVMLIGTLPFAASADGYHVSVWYTTTEADGYSSNTYRNFDIVNGHIDARGWLLENMAEGVQGWTIEGAPGTVYPLINEIEFEDGKNYNVFAYIPAPSQEPDEPQEPEIEYCQCGEELTDDHDCVCDICGKYGAKDTEHDCLVWCDRCQESRYAHEHAQYVDVILNVKADGSYDENDYFRCWLLEDGTIDPDDRDEIYFTSSKLNIVSWKAEGYGQVNTLLDYSFAKLEKPINIYPVYGSDGDDSNNENSENTGSGTTTTTEYITLKLYVDGEGEGSYKFNKDSAKVSALLADKQKSSWDFLYFNINDSAKDYTTLGTEVERGDTVKVYFETHTSKLNSNKVYLHVFMNNDFDDPVKNINITKGIAADGKVDLNSDVKSVIKDYFTAKDSDGIEYDGMYYSVGSWVGDFLADDKDETITNINELKEDGYVHLNVMITNAKLKSSSTADSTNPKTGDNIFVAVSVMTIAAGALAVAFYLNKKRAV